MADGRLTACLTNVKVNLRIGNGLRDELSVLIGNAHHLAVNLFDGYLTSRLWPILGKRPRHLRVLRGPLLNPFKAPLHILAGKIRIAGASIAMPARIAVNIEFWLGRVQIGACILRLLVILRLLNAGVQCILLRLDPDHRECMTHIEVEHQGHPFPSLLRFSGSYRR